jgi:dephospho-CoA kinase
MRIIVLCGLPGVGKLTVARGLANLRGYRVFHNHLIFDAVEALFPFDSAVFAELRERLWRELLSRAAAERIGDCIFTLAADRALSGEFLVTLVRELSDLGADVRCVELTCSRECHARRLVSHDRRQFGKVSSVERYRELDAEGALPRLAMPPEVATIDTSGLSVSETVAAVDARTMGDS